MNTHILTTRDADAWRGYLTRLPGADIYHTPEYHAAHEANGDGTALCFVADDWDSLLLHPVMVRQIPGTEWSDAESVYGYSGPLFRDSLDLCHCLARAWHFIEQNLQARKVIAEFIRFNPLSGNERCHGLHGLYEDRETVVVDLSGSPDDLWGRYLKGHRYEIRKAERRGLFPLGPDGFTELGAFGQMYQDTMDRNGADDYYRFSDSYFHALAAGMGNWLRMLAVVDVGDVTVVGPRLVAAALFITYRDRMHYHLAGSDEHARGTGANNLLLHHAALWGQEHGYRWLHLGGGRANAPDDSLFRFKESISNGRLPFYVGKRIHNEAAYRQLCDEWRARHPEQDGGGYFLLWRKP